MTLAFSPLALAPLAASLAGQAVTGVAKALSPEKKAQATANQFETMFLENAFERLFESDSEEGPLGNSGPGSDFYKSLLVKEYAGGIVKSGGVGISQQIYSEMLKWQEGAGS
jgi:peptidoglycan hydrolase FlgJ